MKSEYSQTTNFCQENLYHHGVTVATGQYSLDYCQHAAVTAS